MVITDVPSLRPQYMARILEIWKLNGREISLRDVIVNNVAFAKRNFFLLQPQYANRHFGTTPKCLTTRILVVTVMSTIIV